VNLKPQYDDESQFIKDLYLFLNDEINGIESDYTEEESDFEVYEEMQMPTRSRKPDLTIIPDKNIDLGYRQISDRIFVECKLGSEEYPISNLRKNLNQMVRYKYKLNSPNHRSIEKYGDYHVVAVTLGLVAKNIEDIDSVNSESDYKMSGKWFITSMWALGLGLLYRHSSRNLVASFNEREKLTFDIEQKSVEDFL
jgi:hypothetical protein